MPMTRKYFLIALCLGIASDVRGDSVPAISWIHHFGTPAYDLANGIAIDAAGDVYVVGETSGSMNGLAPHGSDAFIRKFTGDGHDVWVRQLRSEEVDAFESAYGVAVDSVGRVWMVGATTGDLLGNQITGGRDGLISSYDSSGNLLLLRQIGLGPGQAEDEMFGVTTDRNGNAFITGIMGGNPNVSRSAGRAVVFKYDSVGVKWSAEIDSDKTEAAGSAAIDSSNALYVGGGTAGAIGTQNYGSYDAFIRKYDTDRKVSWTLQFGGSGFDGIDDLCVDPLGNLIVLAFTSGNFGGASIGSRDLLLRKYNPAGQLLWNKKFGTQMLDDGVDISLDAIGNIYLAGMTEGSLGGPNAGYRDLFVQKYNEAGTLIWTHQFGTPSSDILTGIEVASPGVLYATGYTTGSLNGLPLAGSYDSFLVKLVEVPEPSCLQCLIPLLIVIAGHRHGLRARVALFGNTGPLRP